MRITTRLLTTIALFLGGVFTTFSQELRTEISIDFRVNCVDIDSTYSDNAAKIREMMSFLKNLSQDKHMRLVEISLCGAASPEGSDQLNRKLAKGRIESIENLIRQQIDYPENIVIRNDSYIPWEWLKEKVEQSDMEHKEEVLAILGQEGNLVDYHHPDTHIDERIVKIRKIDSGKTWDLMHELFFEPMRNACAIFVTTRFKAVPQTRSEMSLSAVPMGSGPGLAPKRALQEQVDWIRNIHVKTNAVGWALGAGNISAEVDIIKHLSLSLAAYYSGWDYFKTTLKFRTLSIQPELRYYPVLKSMQNDGFFVGAHFGLGYYNYALNKEWRIQDHKGRRPSLGGGLSVGYALQFKKNPRWGMEFAVGGGVYDSLYDVFYNEANGPYAESAVRKTWIGVDNASIAVTYKFDIKKNGGRK